MHNSATHLFKDTFDGVLLPTSSLAGSDFNEEHLISSAAQC